LTGVNARARHWCRLESVYRRFFRETVALLMRGGGWETIMALSRGWRIRGAAFVAAMILLASPARAGCNASDIFNAAKNTVTGLSACESACSNQASCAVAIWMTAVLSGIAVEGGQGIVNSFCSQAQGSASQIVGKLQSVGGSSVGQSLLGEVASKLESVGAAAQVVSCACQTEQGLGALSSDIGECMSEFMCWLQSEMGLGACECTPPPPQIANCASVDLKKCQNEDYLKTLSDPACGASNSIGNSNQQCKNFSYMKDVQYTYSCTTTSEGTLVQALPPTAEGTGCNPVYYCFCPAGMTPAWPEVANPNSSDKRYAFACNCPDGTHPGAVMPNGISSCLCDNTNQPAILSGLAINGMCPPPACPEGQTRLGGDGPCVTPCADPKQGMAFDGSCCDPAQMSSCGKCCPLDTVPNAQTGSCEPRPKPPK
jgi:hypothetical protein